MSKSQRTILIIDDNPDDLAFYTHLLQDPDSQYNYKVLTAETAAEGLEAYQNNTIDCTFVDYNLPNSDGLSIIESLKEADSRQHLAALIFTGVPHQQVQAEAARQGALDYITKDQVDSLETMEAVVTKTINWAETLNRSEASTDDD